MKHRKKSTLIIGSIVIALMLIYFVGTVFFTDHFMAGTFINGVDCSLSHYDNVEKNFNSEIDNYELIIKEKDCADEKILPTDVDLEVVKGDSFLKLVRNQNRLKWPVLCTKRNELNATGFAKINEKKAEKFINSLNCMDDEGKYPSKNAVPEYNGDKFVVKKEVYGNVADKKKTVNVLKSALKDFQREINLEETECYILPERYEGDAGLEEACAKMNNYCKATITYDMISHTEVVDKDIISKWVTCDDELNVVFDEDKVKEYMREFGKKYDTVGKQRNFTAPNGKSASVSGGTYGWTINEKEETEELLKLILEGATVTREPIYKQRAATHGEQDWGDNYCEIDLSAQYMWCVKSGKVAYECPVVTGKPNGHATPSGVYTVLNKARNATLVGRIDPETGEPIYRTPVSFWMPVTYSGVGMHDATWQPTFGGNWYRAHGSHGCINMSYSSAATIYNLVYIGMPVILHY